MRVVKSRQPLLQASKLLYRLSKDTANDTVFRREKLLEPLVRTVRTAIGMLQGNSGDSCLNIISNPNPPR